MEAEDDLAIKDLIGVFDEMEFLKTYDVVADRDLMTALRSSIERIRDARDRDRTLKLFSEFGKRGLRVHGNP